jgi:type IV secretion system protein VirB10
MSLAGEDPRTIERSARPLVAPERRGLPSWLIVAMILLFGIILFLILNGQRLNRSSPVTNARFAETGLSSPIAPLYVPPLPEPSPVRADTIVAPEPPRPTPSPVPIAPPSPQIVYIPPPVPPQPAPQSARPQRVAPTSALVVDTTSGSGQGAVMTGEPGASTAGSSGGGEGSTAVASREGRARAIPARNRGMTVPEGTLVPAVLETALDSTRPGPARALVTSDVRSFDGATVLIPRGSRLVGEYKADLQPGQNRALVIWNRLIRPDGATIAIASPASDPLGRVGIKGQVNSHFLERFGSALLNTTLNVGVGLASRIGSRNSVAVLALPGALGGTVQPIAGAEQVQRTLRVRQGVSIAVFVARDLDFSRVGPSR